MASTSPTRPRVSRETRLLLGIVLVALVALWVLARLRFPDRASGANPVPPLLTQLTPRSTFEDLASSVALLGPRLEPSLMALNLDGRSGMDRAGQAGLRIRNDVAVTLLPPGLGFPETISGVGLTFVGRDPASGLAVTRLPAADTPALEQWTPRAIGDPRFLIVSRTAHDGSSFHPVFVSSLTPAPSPIWSGSIWVVPPDAGLRRGTFVFSTTGAWAGLVGEHDGRPAIVPTDLVLQMADRLLSEGPIPHGRVGIAVQTMDPAVAAAAGTSNGVVVTWVDRDGPAAGRVSATDVIEAVDGEPVLSAEHWRTRIDRTRAGQTFTLRVRRGTDVRTVQIAAAGAVPSGRDRALGLILRTIPRVGVEVLSVQPASAAARAGIEPGDIITVIGRIDAPAPEEVTGAYAAATPERPVLAAVTRGQAHHVLALNK